MVCTDVYAAINGTVTDTMGNHVQGALVTFTDESNPENKYCDYTDSDGMYELTITPVLVEEKLPQYFHLHQNYLNSFNPTTTILYSIENAGFVNLSIYNIMGQKI